MKQTWRWFGPSDPISIADIRQTGATGIVSALHDIPNGEVWPVEAIRQRQLEIEGDGSGLTWDVVESLPVSEDIKLQTAAAQTHLDAYKDSLHNLAACGIRTVCYNFMPVLDWTRTAMRHPLPNGGQAMRFDLIDFVAFDCFLLRREGARADYGDATIAAAEARFNTLSDQQKRDLSDTVIAGLPGAEESWTHDSLTERLATYRGVTADDLRGHLIDFLSEVVPVAERLGMRLCCHPDDPPFPLLGLPRIMSSLADFEAILTTVDSPANGATFCTGSLGVAPEFAPRAFIERLGPRIHFAHLRNTVREGASDGARHSFTEAEHLAGDTDMVATIRALLSEEVRRRAAGRNDWEIPMRPDHGQVLLSDFQRPVRPGYPLIGRMRGLAELRGVMQAVATPHPASDRTDT